MKSDVVVLLRYQMIDGVEYGAPMLHYDIEN